MKKIKKFFINFFGNKENEKELKRKTFEIKNLFRTYFEGFYYDGSFIQEPIDPILIKNFEITDFTIDFLENETVINITLVRPGLLIGKGGKTIDGVRDYIRKFYASTRIHLIESNLWI